MNPGVNAICTKHEGHSAVKKAVAALGATLPPVGSEMIEYIDKCIEAAGADDLGTLSKNLGLIITGCRAPIDDPDTNLARMPELLSLLDRKVAASEETYVRTSQRLDELAKI